MSQIIGGPSPHPHPRPPSSYAYATCLSPFLQTGIFYLLMPASVVNDMAFANVIAGLCSAVGRAPDS